MRVYKLLFFDVQMLNENTDDPCKNEIHRTFNKLSKGKYDQSTGKYKCCHLVRQYNIMADWDIISCGLIQQKQEFMQGKFDVELAAELFNLMCDWSVKWLISPEENMFMEILLRFDNALSPKLIDEYIETQKSIIRNGPKKSITKKKDGVKYHQL